MVPNERAPRNQPVRSRLGEFNRLIDGGDASI